MGSEFKIDYKINTHFNKILPHLLRYLQFLGYC